MPATPAVSKAKASPGKFKKISEPMAQWSALLGTELLTWPQVAARRMFGCTAYYRNGSIFAILPLTREFFAPNQVGFKFPRSKPYPAKLKAKIQRDSRARVGETFQHWIMFALQSDRDFRDFLEYCAHAHQDAK